MLPLREASTGVADFFGFVELQVDQLESGLIAHPAEGLALQECIGIVEPEDIYSSSTGVLGAVQQARAAVPLSAMKPAVASCCPQTPPHPFQPAAIPHPTL